MRDEFIQDNDQRDFYNQVAKLNDREVLELQAFYAKQQKDFTKKIMNNVQFFFYFFIVSSVITIFLVLK